MTALRFIPVLVALLFCSSCKSSSSRTVYEDDFSNKNTNYWSLNNSIMNRDNDAIAVLNASSDGRSFSNITTDLPLTKKSRLVRVTAQFCCNVEFGKANLWMTIQVNGQPLYVVHGSSRVAGSEGKAVFSAVVPIPSDASRILMGAFNSSLEKITIDDFHVEELSRNEAQATDVRLKELESLLISKSVYLRGISQAKRANISEFARLLSSRKAIDVTSTDSEQLLVRYAGDIHTRVVLKRKQNTHVPAHNSLPVSHVSLGDIGYIKVDGIALEDNALYSDYVDTISKTIEGFNSRKLKWLLVDLRDNYGGNMWPTICGIKRLLPEQFGSFDDGNGTVMSWNAELTNWQASTKKIMCPTTYGDIKFDHVVVLISERTASSGEATAIALKSINGASLVGTPSAGFTTANDLEMLTDGTMVSLSSSFMKKPDGTIDGAPLNPDMLVEQLHPGLLSKEDIEKIITTLDSK